MMDLITGAFETLQAAGCVSSQRAFSMAWLGKSPTYMSSMVARAERRQPSPEVLLILYSRIRHYAADADFNAEHRQVLDLLAEKVWTAAMDRIHDGNSGGSGESL